MSCGEKAPIERLRESVGAMIEPFRLKVVFPLMTSGSALNFQIQISSAVDISGLRVGWGRYLKRPLADNIAIFGSNSQSHLQLQALPGHNSPELAGRRGTCLEPKYILTG